MSNTEGEMQFELIEINNGNGQQLIESESPKRVTTSLALRANEVEKAEIARNQLMSLSKKPKKKASPANSDNEVLQKPTQVEVPKVVTTSSQSLTEIIYDGKPTMSNLSSAIISREELENEIRKKIVKNDEFDIEIPQELILSEITAPPSDAKEVEQVQLDGQELIDILEGNPDNDSETYEVIGGNGIFVVKQAGQQDSSFEIVSPEEEIVTSTKKKMLERQIAMQQIASMPMRKNRKRTEVSPKNQNLPSSQRSQTLAQSLAMDWSDKEEEVLFEVENADEVHPSETKIKILNMTILNEPTPKVVKPEPKILNKNFSTNTSPPKIIKILNKNAPTTTAIEEPSSFKRNRVIKKKEIWDPSASTSKILEKSPSIALPAAITIKKLTKESIANAVAAKELPTVQTTPQKKTKKKSEIDRLFQDEGAVNMMYSLERRNNNRDVPEVKVAENQAFVDKSEEKSALMAKQQSIRKTILKQSTSPPDVKTSSRPQRVKRDLTPSKPVIEPSKVEKTPEKVVIVTKAPKNASAGRKKKSEDDAWDFVRNAQTTCDDAMIIRRHSSSSYSSSAPTSPRRLSLDQFTKPQEKKSNESPKDLKSSAVGLVEELRNTLNSALTKAKGQGVRGRKRGVVAAQESHQAKRKANNQVNCVVDEGVAHVTFSSKQITVSLLNELKTILSQLETNTSCKVVLITANEETLNGLDYSSLIQTSVEKRKHAATELATAIKNFLTTLATFPKITVCGVKLLTTGLSLTMLPLFDVVIAEQNAKFSLSNASIGCNPEGISIFQLSPKVNCNAITQLLFLQDTLDTKTALQYGLISKVVNGNISDHAKEICMKISSSSLQTMESTKKILTEELRDSIDRQLTKEFKVLQQQWISAEFQEKFKKFSSTGEW